MAQVTSTYGYLSVQENYRGNKIPNSTCTLVNQIEVARVRYHVLSAYFIYPVYTLLFRGTWHSSNKNNRTNEFCVRELDDEKRLNDDGACEIPPMYP